VVPREHPGASSPPATTGTRQQPANRGLILFIYSLYTSREWGFSHLRCFLRFTNASYTQFVCCLWCGGFVVARCLMAFFDSLISLNSIQHVSETCQFLSNLQYLYKCCLTSFVICALRCSIIFFVQCTSKTIVCFESATIWAQIWCFWLVSRMKTLHIPNLRTQNTFIHFFFSAQYGPVIIITGILIVSVLIASIMST